ncbi:MAG: zinc ribbon domain-containing protein [Actinobacteria bacterium]|nr:zinc ribbon domain-containing protein [Actinomycetota bacterium]
MTYDYVCLNCDTSVEKERSINDAEPTYLCKDCGYRLQRVYTPAVISFKGGGFYTTDRR